MRIRESFEYPASPFAVSQMLADPAFQVRKCEASHPLSHSEKIEAVGDKTRITTRRVLPTTDLPDFVKSMIGAEIAIIETYLWNAPATDGSRDGTLTVNIGEGNLPIAMNGTITLAPRGSGSIIEVDGELKAKVMLIGGKIEKAAEPAVRDAIAKERQTGLAWLGA